MIIFSRTNTVRNFLQRIVTHNFFDNGILILIFLSTILLVLDNPLANPHDFAHRVRDTLNLIMTSIFILECLIKIIVLGFICNGPESYMKSNWNKLDFAIALVSSLSFLNQYENQIIKVFRLLRVLRPLRLVHRLPHMRISIESIIQAVPQFTNLLSIFFLSLLLFSILGTTFFKGLFASCSMNNVHKAQ